MAIMKKLYRSGQNKMIAGVCGGIAEYLEIDPTVIRLLWIVFTILSLGFGGVLAYILAWIIMPKNPKHKWY